jgi:hypothetical protein
LGPPSTAPRTFDYYLRDLSKAAYGAASDESLEGT